MTAQGEGWFADPQDTSRLRWWDGTRWTEHTHPGTGTAQWDTPLPRWWSGFSRVVQGSLLGCVAASSFTLWVDLETLTWEERCAALADSCMEHDKAVDPRARFQDLRRRYGPGPLIDLQERRAAAIREEMRAVLGRDPLDGLLRA